MDFKLFCDEVETKIKDIYNLDRSQKLEDKHHTPPKISHPIHCPSCGHATVKPKTVLFGSSLPAEFFELAALDLPTTDLLIVAGTSLVVSPANSLVYNVPDATMRVIVNDEPVGTRLGIEYGPNAKRDFFADGNCDDVFLELICALGWLQDVNAVIDNLAESSVILIQERIEQCANGEDR